LVGRWTIGRLLLTKVWLSIAARSGAEYCKTETVLKYALRKSKYSDG
jgi:hypothetical protein